VEKLQLSPIPLGELLTPERFLKELWVNGAFIQVRIESFRYKVIFEADYPEIVSKLRLIGEALRVIMQSTSFQQMIRTVLRIGNFLNSNTPKGNVAVSVTQGISLDSLRQLESFLSLDKKSSLLQFIIASALARSKSALTFISEFEVCEAAAQSDLSDAELKLKELDTGLTKVKDSLKKLESARDADMSLYKEYMSSFVTGAGVQMEDLRMMATKVRADQAVVAELYAENKEGKTSELVRKFWDFAMSCKRVREKMSVEEGKRQLAKKEQTRPEARPSHRPGPKPQPRLSVRRRKDGLVAL